MYLPNMWDVDFDCQQTLSDVNYYHETSPYKAKNNQEDSKWGKYKLVNYGYSADGGENHQGNVVM